MKSVDHFGEHTTIPNAFFAIVLISHSNGRELKNKILRRIFELENGSNKATEKTNQDVHNLYSSQSIRVV